MRTNSRRDLMRLAAILSAVMCPRPSFAIDPLGFDWPARCTSIRDGLALEPGLDHAFVERPSLELPPMWRIEVAGITVPVPVAEYALLMSVDRDGLLSALLVHPDEAHINLIQATHPEPIEDIWLLAGETVSTGPGADLTRRLFGGPVDLLELTRLGFRHTLTDLTCLEEAFEREIPIAIALILRAIGSHVLVAYEGVGAADGWTTNQLIEPGRYMWTANVILNDLMWQLTHFVPTSSEFTEVGTLTGFSWTLAEGQPEWLTRLGPVLTAPDNATHWEALNSALEAAGIDASTVEAARDQLVPANDGP